GRVIGEGRTATGDGFVEAGGDGAGGWLTRPVGWSCILTPPYAIAAIKSVMRTVVVTLVASRIWLTSHMTGALRFGYGLVEQLRAPGHELVAARAGADELDVGSDELADPLDVVAAG